MKQTSLLPLAVLATLGCRSTPFPEHVVLDDPAARDSLHAQLTDLRPPAKAVHRALFARGRDQVTLTMYSDFEAPDTIKLAAVSDLGVTVFQLESTPQGVRVLHESKAFPKSFLEDYLLPDLLAVYAIPPVEECELVRVELGEGRTALSYLVGSSRVLAYDSGATGLQQYQRGRNGVVLSELELSASPAAGPSEAPRYQLHITSAAGSYTTNLVITSRTGAGG